jgi:hypothetical protein
MQAKKNTLDQAAKDLLHCLYLYNRMADAMKVYFLPSTHNEFMHGLLVKLFQHAASLYVLSRGTEIDNAPLKVHFWDFASGYVLLRAGLETYSQFRYIFTDSKDFDEREFKICIEQISGLSIRGMTQTDIPELLAKKEYEKTLILEIQLRLKETNKYKTLTKSADIKSACKGQYGPTKTQKLKNALSEMSSETVSAYYGFASDYAHSGYISLLQNLEADTPDKQKEHLKLSIAGFKSLLTSVINDLINMYPKIAHFDSSIISEIRALL